MAPTPPLRLASPVPFASQPPSVSISNDTHRRIEEHRRRAFERQAALIAPQGQPEVELVEVFGKDLRIRTKTTEADINFYICNSPEHYKHN